MKHLFLSLLVLLGTATVWSETKMETHSSQAPKAKVTVLHLGAPW